MSGPHDTPSTVTIDRQRPPQSDHFRLIFAAIFALLAAIFGFVHFWPDADYAIYAPELDEVINTTAVVIAGSVAVRAWVRFREAGDAGSLLYASAFLILCVDGLLRLVLHVLGSPLYEGFILETAGQGPLYGWTVRRLLAAGLLLLGALLAARRWRPIRLSEPIVLLVPAALAALFSTFALTNADEFPALIPPGALADLLQPGETFDVANISWPWLVSQLIVGALFLAAAIVCARRADNGRRTYDAVLSVALLVAAFSQLHYSLVPGVYSELVPSGDYLRVLFYLLMLAAMAAASRDDLIQLRHANTELEVLRAEEGERAAAFERERMAREIHDGIAQELWLARLTTGSLAQSAGLVDDDRQLVDRLDGILDRALAEARQAVVSLQPNVDESFAGLLHRFVDDYADRFGIDVECVTRGDDRLHDPRVEAELLRICREALNNVHKHADATLTRVHLEEEEDHVLLTITDNGRGFETDRVRSGFGMQSMAQRAGAIGAVLDVKSAPMDGTRVAVEIKR